MRGRFSVNLLANMAGTGWAGVVQLVCVPLYIRFLGMEAYGLVGFYVALQATLRILDLGLAPTMTREMARYAIQPEKAEEMRDLARTMEVVYWIIGLLVGAVICGMSGTIAAKWIKVEVLSIAEVKRSLVIAGCVTAVQWPLSLYQGGLTGLHRQPLLNAIKICGATLNGLAVVLTLWLVSSTVVAFFLTQLITGTVQAFVTAIAFWKCLPKSRIAARVDIGAIRRIGHFLGGMSGIGLFGMILTQMDKVVLSKLLPLQSFGFYTLAAFVASSLQLFVAPMFGVIFPQLSALVAADDVRQVRDLYHGGTQVMSVMIFPSAMVVMLLTVPAMLAWTGNPEIAKQAAPVAALLMAGTAVNGLMYMPYALQLAYGWTKPALWTTASMCVVFVPSLYMAVRNYGATGAAFVWMALNVVAIVIVVIVTHSRLLRGEAWRWIREDVGPPLAAVAILVFTARAVLGVPANRGTATLDVTVTFALAVAAAALCSPRVRARLLSWGRGRHALVG